MSTTIVVGRIGKDAELRTMQDGTAVASFSVAENLRDKAKTTQWWRCAMFGKRAESLAQYLTKGAVVEVVGQASLNTYEGKSGPVTELQLRVSDVGLHGGKPSGDAPVADRGRATKQDEMNQDIPF